MNEWLLLIPMGVLMLVKAPALAWMHYVNESDRRKVAHRDPSAR